LISLINDSHTKTSISYVEQDCVKTKAMAAGTIISHMYNQNYVADVVSVGNNSNQGLYYAKDKAASQIFPDPAINGDRGETQYQTDGANNTSQQSSLVFHAQRLSSQQVELEDAPATSVNINVDLSSNTSFHNSLA
jgi:hypothetical protein